MIDDAIPLIAATATASDGASGSVTALLFYVSVGLGVSFLCSILEAVLLSSSVSHVEMTADSGSRAGLLMQHHKRDVERPISAILTLNTIAHTVGAAGAGAEAAALFGNQWLGVISAVLTLLILVFSEIIPKTLGAVYWKQLMPAAAYTIQFLVLALYPMVWLFQKLTAVIASDEREPTVTRDELEVLAKVSGAEGALNAGETLILANLLKLDEVSVSDIMTPRTVLFMLEDTMTVQEVLDKHKILSYSRIPIYTDSPDDITKFVLRLDVLRAAADNELDKTMADFSRPILSVPETLSVTVALEKFMREKAHILHVFDEYGGTAGIVTLEDAIESLLGAEITDESDAVVDLQALARKRSLQNGHFNTAPISNPNPAATIE